MCHPELPAGDAVPVDGADTDHDFWVIQLPYGRPSRITSFGRLEFPSNPSWSPDATQIAYSFYQLPNTGGIPLPPGTDVYVMNADGSGQHAVATHNVMGAVLQPAVAHADGDLWDLWTIGVDGRNLHRITAINEDLPVSAWSGDGQFIAFLGGGSAATAEAGVSIVDAAGGALLRLTTQPGHRGLDWTDR